MIFLFYIKYSLNIYFSNKILSINNSFYFSNYRLHHHIIYFITYDYQLPAAYAKMMNNFMNSGSLHNIWIDEWFYMYDILDGHDLSAAYDHNGSAYNMFCIINYV